MKILILVFSLLSAFPLIAKDLRFAVVPKFYGVFFDQSKQGCQQAAKTLEGVECIYRGPEIADVRIQDKIITQLIKEKVDGIAVAVTQSNFLARSSMQKAKRAGIPIVTYDSDFDSNTLKKYSDLRLAYIGTDNFELGKALAEELKKLRPNGGSLIIQSGRPDSPNLNLRIMGVRSALSGKTYKTAPGNKLKKEQGWTEVREPTYNFDQVDRSIQQMEQALRGQPIKSDAFIAVGGWSQNDDALYRNMIAPFKEKLANKEVAVVISDASNIQLNMLRDGLAHANVGQNPSEMGKQAILTLYKIVKKQKYNKTIFTPLRRCNSRNFNTCTKGI